ncbi:type IV pilus biogenesis/stability protein PilW [Niveibacterium umoris]|uniref:type IV pilus biogenesis/stability protein PilW n=1 Tax=Niveibacterium umoris TaxID=1193620 RepID=UPI0030B80643
MTRVLLVVVAAAALSACGTGGSSQGGSGVSDRPSSEQPVTTEARKRARAHVELGNEYVKAGRLGVAMEEARIAVREDPSYAAAHHLQAQVHAYLEEQKAAQSEFERALSLAPGDPEIANSFGWFLCTNGQEKRGLELLAKAAQNPYYENPTRPYTNSGLCYLKLKDDDAARGQFNRALALDGNNAVALFNLAEIAYRKGEFTKARELVTQLNRIGDPTAASVWLGLRVERKLGNRDAEAAYVSQLKRRFSASQEYQDYLQERFD